jgi:hypothetical protein
LVHAVARYLSARLVKDGMSVAMIAALAIDHPVVSAYSRVRSATSVLINVRHLH